MRQQLGSSVICWIAGAALASSCSAQDVDPDRSPAGSVGQTLALAICGQESECDAGLACVAGTCQPCSRHGQCQSDVCDEGAATSLGPGACVTQDSVVYVDVRARPACTLGDGSRANPVCEVGDGIVRAVGRQYAVRVYPGRYRPFRVDARTVFVFGPGDGSAIVGEEDLSAGARVTTGARAVLDGLDFGVSVLTGVVCQGSSLDVRHASVRGDSFGIRATDCDLQIDRVRAVALIRSGLTVTGTGTYRITNSYFHGGDVPSVVLGGSTTGVFQFNTVTGGGEISPGGVDCGTSARSIRDSIVVGNAPGANGAQTVGACIHRRVVVGSGDLRPLPGLIKIDPELDSQGRLLDTPADRACCIDQGARYVSSLYKDFFGTPRPQGSSNDIGAHELPQGVPADAELHDPADKLVGFASREQN